MNAFQFSGPKLFEGEKWCVWTGVLGPVMGVLIWIYVQIFGNVEPVHGGDLLRAASFCAASGIFILGIAAFVPFANFKPGMRKFIDFYIIFSGIVSYVLETYQHARGVSPRMPENLANPFGFDFIISQVFGVTAIGIIWYTVMVLIGVFRQSALAKRPIMVWAARYAMIGCLLGFVGGAWMIADFTITRNKDLSHSIYYLHGYAFHGLQAVPFMAFFLERASISDAMRRKLVHWGGLTFTLSIVLLGLQVLVNHKSLFHITPIMILAALTVAMWAGFFIYSGILYLRGRRDSGNRSIGGGQQLRQSS